MKIFLVYVGNDCNYKQGEFLMVDLPSFRIDFQDSTSHKYLTLGLL